MIQIPFWARQLVNWSLLSTGLHKLPSRETKWPSYFDNTDGIGAVKRPLFYKHSSGVLLPFKGRPKPIDPKKKIGIECHITAVAFGTSSSARSFWKKALYEGLLDQDLWERYSGFDGLIEQAPSEVIDATCVRLALHQRFFKVPYNWVGLLNGDVLFNNDISRHVYAGNGGNSTMIQVSIEGNYPGLEKNRSKKYNNIDEFIIQTGRKAVELSYQDGKNQGADLGLLTAHRQYSKGRIGDPGEGVWKEIFYPTAKKLGLEVDYKFKDGDGYQICREWDEKGIVDYYGRRI